MVGAPKKRNARIIALSSDEDEDAPSTTPPIPSKLNRIDRQDPNIASLPSRVKADEQATVNTQSSVILLDSTPETSPQKPASKVSKGKLVQEANGKPIHSFFNATNHKRQLKRASPEKETAGVEKKEEVDDVIQDEPSEDEAMPMKKARAPGPKLLARTKRTRSEYEDIESRAPQLPASQKFLKTAERSRVRTPSITAGKESHDPRPWVEKYGPLDLDDLVVHKKKVADVKKWVEEALQGQRYRRLLVLKGPAGSGKTATTSLLSATLGFELVEWRNPAAADFLSSDYVSAGAQFEDFLGRSSKFGSLDFATTDETREGTFIATDMSKKADTQIILIEEFPTIISRATPVLQNFRNTILQSLAVNNGAGSGQSASSVNPIVMVISESTTSSASNPSEDFTAHRLLGTEILNHPAATVIEFNPVAPTFITRALNMTLEKHSRVTGTRYNPSTSIIQKLSEIGDVRNAISTLEFLCLQMNSSVTAPSTQVKSKTRSRSSKGNATASDEAALSILSLRESTLGLFHAVGKVVYNKRTHPASPPSVPIPPHSAHLARPFASDVDPTTLIDETGTDTSTFLASLHENYLLSCFDPGGDSEATLDAVNDCLDALCDADLLSASSSPFSSSNHNSSGGRTDEIRQSDIAFHLAVRGILRALPHPVKRQAPPPNLLIPHASSASATQRPPHPRKRAADMAAHKMYYPQGLKLWRARDEVQGLLDDFAVRALDGRLDAQVRGDLLARKGRLRAHPPPRFVTFLLKTQMQAQAQPFMQKSRPGEENKEGTTTTTTNAINNNTLPVAIGSGHSARREMLLERLPYLARILQGGGGSAFSSSSCSSATAATTITTTTTLPPHTSSHTFTTTTFPRLHATSSPTMTKSSTTPSSKTATSVAITTTPTTSTSALQRQIERITRFTGLLRGTDDDEENDEEDDDHGSGGGRARAREAEVKGARAGTGAGTGTDGLGFGLGLDEGVQGLVLSDDDIVDD